MRVMDAATVSIGAAAIVVFFWWGKENPPPPERLTEVQKSQIEQRVRDLSQLGQLEYAGEPLSPPVVVYDVSNEVNLAEASCSRSEMKLGVPVWVVRINEKLAASCFGDVMRETIPHEVAHLVNCRLTDHWPAHSAGWQNITRYLGAEPKVHHTCGGPKK